MHFGYITKNSDQDWDRNSPVRIYSSRPSSRTKSDILLKFLHDIHPWSGHKTYGLIVLLGNQESQDIWSKLYQLATRLVIIVRFNDLNMILMKCPPGELCGKVCLGSFPIRPLLVRLHFHGLQFSMFYRGAHEYYSPCMCTYCKICLLPKPFVEFVPLPSDIERCCRDFSFLYVM